MTDVDDGELAQNSRMAPPSVVVPVYNEADNIAALVHAVEGVLVPPFSMIIVFDHDEDTTVPVVRELSQSRPWLRLHQNQFGPGVLNALRSGFAQVKVGPVIVMMGDLSDDVRALVRMVDLYREGFDIVCASRYMKGGAHVGGPLVKKGLAHLAGISLHALIGLPTHDATNNFRLYDAEMLQVLGVQSRAGFEIALELTVRAFHQGFAITETPSVWQDRVAGVSRFRLGKWLPHYLRWYLHAFRHRPASSWQRGRPDPRKTATGAAPSRRRP